MISIPKNHQQSIILEVLYSQIKAKVTNQIELPKSKTKLIEITLKIEFIAAYWGYDSGIHTFQGLGTGSDNTRVRKRGKRMRSKVDLSGYNTSGPATSRVQ